MKLCCQNKYLKLQLHHQFDSGAIQNKYWAGSSAMAQGLLMGAHIAFEKYDAELLQ